MLDDFAWGEFTLKIDCDVLQADGGTRTAAITGSYAALGIALRRMQREKALRPPVAAVSIGIIAGQVLLDLDYEEDFAAEVDLNVVGNAAGELLEVQGTAEKRPFTPAQLTAMVALAQKGLTELHAKQIAAIAGAFAK
jgi:ribonuclease PH